MGDSMRSHEYQALLNNIPGGIQQCLNDAFFTVVEVNQGFLDLFGFSRLELKERFDDRFIEMIHPEDRARVLAEAAETLSRGEKAVLNYRVLCSDRSYKWVTDNAQLIRNEKEEERIFCILIDDTESRNAREKLRLSLERFQIIMDQTADIIFEWDIAADTISYSGNWVKKFGYEAVSDHVSARLPLSSNIYPDDMPAFMAFIKAARCGKVYSTVELRIRNAEGRYIWCRIRATDQFDDSGAPLKAIGVITDIDEDRRTMDDLRCRAAQDALTGLYNREETERQIRRYMQEHPDETCALLMIDTDNFKGVNDQQGHLFGDSVLTELAAGMKKLTRQSDVVGRIGGDEFVIFLKNLPSREKAAEKAAQLLDIFQHLFQADKRPSLITCSAGVAMFPDDGKDFRSLYRSADQALYQAKSRGKNQYVMFDRKNTVSVEQTGYSALGASIDSDQQSAGVPGDLMSYVFTCCMIPRTLTTLCR